MSITNGYCTLNQVKAAVRITDLVDDTLLEMAVESASRLIDAECDRVFYNAGTAVRYFVPTDRLTCNIDDAITITEVASDDDGTGTYSTVWAASDYQLEPVNGRAGGAPWPWTRIRGIGDPQFYRFGEEATVKVTATWGFGTAVPTMVTQACVIQAARIFKRLDSPLGVAGFGDLGAIRVSRTDPDVAALLAPFKKIAVA